MTVASEQDKRREVLQQASRILREWAGERQQASGKWTSREQAGVECAIKLDELAKTKDSQLVADLASALKGIRCAGCGVDYGHVFEVIEHDCELCRDGRALLARVDSLRGQQNE